jgi:serine/threonine-protein kinase
MAGIEGPVGTISTDLLAGRYQLGPLLGAGGMGEVRAGRDLRLGREVAVKALRGDLAARPEVRRRFEGEGRAAARLCHPHVVSVYDVGEHEGVPYLVMERVAGPNLAQEMARGPMDPARVRRLGTDVLAALEAAHSAGIVHRDVKPGNVLLTTDGSAKVADFGIAKAVDEEAHTAAGVDLTEAGQLIGTVAYMAPERLAGEPATVAADLYSVGVLLHEAMTGRRPYPGSGPLGGDLDPALVAIIERALAVRPQDRYATAAEMAAALRAADTDPTVQVEATPTAVAPAPLAATPVARRRRATPVVAAAVVGGILTLVAAALLDEGGSARPPASTAPSTQPATTPAPSPLGDALDRLEDALR